MRAFIVFSCLALAAAAPQYNYQQPPAPVQSYAAPVQSYAAPAPVYAQPAPQYSAPAPQYSAQQSYSVASSYAAPAPQVYSAPAPAPQVYAAPAPSYSAPQPQYSGSAQLSQPIAPRQQAIALVQKHIYVHVPPPDHEELNNNARNAPVQSQKHYKIIFIKAPSAPSYASQIIQQQQNTEEKTLVYVLVKKPEGPEDINLADLPQQQPSKPEVYFIKYKNQKEAVHHQGPGVIQAAPQQHSAPLVLQQAPQQLSHQGPSHQGPSHQGPSHQGPVPQLQSLGSSSLSSSSSSNVPSLLSLGSSDAAVASVIQPRQPTGAYGPPK